MGKLIYSLWSTTFLAKTLGSYVKEAFYFYLNKNNL